MVEALFSILEELSQSFRIVDAIDILLVSAFLYAAFVWFQQAASRGVLVGVASLALVYFLARSLDMYLTSLAFHTTFAVLLFILVVVFQEDLRRLLERVASFRSLQPEADLQGTVDLDALVELVFCMAASRTGALIVLKRKEPLGRHLNGGVPLAGKFSVSLLYSIFDSSSPGHDGAVVIDGDMIEQYAAHLPISKNTKQIAGRGTRHSAALGLSEHSDALIIVISEERGCVSVAESGQLVEMKTSTELKQCLEQGITASFPASQSPLWKRTLMEHAGLKILALIVATIAWFVLAYDPHTVQRTFFVPIEYRNLSSQLEIGAFAPTECRVTLSGSDRDFRFLDPASLKIAIDLARYREGEFEIPLSARNMRLPTNLLPYRIDPRVLRLNLSAKTPQQAAAGAGEGAQ